MIAVHGLVLHIEPASGEDAEELAKMAGLLRADLLELDVVAVDPVADQASPADAKGMTALIGWLAVRFGSDGLRAVMRAVRNWAVQHNRVVEVTYGDDRLKVTGATSEQQERIIDAWLARHASGS